MSRKGKLPIVLDKDVKVQVDGNKVTVEGPKGRLEKVFDRSVKFEQTENTLSVHPANGSRLARFMHGTARTVVANMVRGVRENFFKDLEIQGVGFKASVAGRTLELALGYSHPIRYPLPENIFVTVKEGTKLRVEGADKYWVGQVAADIKRYYPVEPYKGKGVRIGGEFVRRKEGKKTA
ncbi:MAG: 50S ribosomal protein L6 [Puniceicoccales bacterium]|jgi:large subunit ribosomal protein L6|nr:50S ribosomal protein L6 [Puniceicoccales bacterium]